MNPVAANGGSGSNSLSAARTASLARKVDMAKMQKLTCSELFCLCLGFLPQIPLLGLTGIIVVPANTTVCVFRFGKLTAQISKPGMTWLLPGGHRIYQFTGTQTHRMDQLHVVDGSGNPIIVRALLEFEINDPAALYIATNSNLGVLFNQAEQVVREACSHLPLLAEKGHDIRSLTHEMGAQMAVELQQDASVFGVVVQRLCIVEARYAPEIASQMLMKQQAQAMVSARKEIVTGALQIVIDTLAEFPRLSEPSREKLINNMLVTLTSQQHATPVLSMD